MQQSLAEQLAGRPARRGTLAPWARALAAQPMPAQYSPLPVGEMSPPQQGTQARQPGAWQMPPEPGPMPQAPQPWQMLDDPTMPQAEPYGPPRPPTAAPRPQQRMAAPQMGGLSADDLNGLMLSMLRNDLPFSPRQGLSPDEIEQARMRIAAVGIPGYGG